MNNQNNSIFNHFTYSIKDNLITNTHISDAINKLFDLHVNRINDYQKIAIIFKILNVDGDWRSIPTLQIITKEDKLKIVNIFSAFC